MEKRSSKSLLSIEKLSVVLPTHRGDVHAVDSISFVLERGKTLGLVGESGCGKTMTAYAIMNLLPRNAKVPEHSAVRFCGKDLTKIRGAEWQKLLGKDMAIIFQDPMTSLNPVITIGRQITEVLHYHLKMNKKAARTRAVELLERVGISLAGDRFHQYPHQLSGGLRQRVAIAIALACEPRLLIADEPTTALDVTVQAEILDLIDQLQAENQMAMILISHDLGVVAGRTHETAVMYAGRIVEQAKTSLLYNDIRMPYTQALVDAIPHLGNPSHTVLRTIGGHPPDLIDLPPGCRFAPRCSKADGRCMQEVPKLINLDKQNHKVACWYPLTT
jgi:peptide/nickel transport system ATP-binding protein